jgi:hypothetical protein
MDKAEKKQREQSEVEAKFRAPHLQIPEVWQFIADNCGRFQIERFKEVAGDDCYYRQGSRVLRHRYDGQRRVSILTVKERKSETSIADRHEIDLPIREDQSPETVRDFLLMTGWERLFAISKNSFIWHLRPRYGAGATGPLACLAVYDVLDQSLPEHEAGWDRYVEIEIEKDAGITHQTALTELGLWVQELRVFLNLGEPINQSLQEIYAPKLTTPDFMFRGVWPDGRLGTEPVFGIEKAVGHGFRVTEIFDRPLRGTADQIR